MLAACGTLEARSVSGALTKFGALAECGAVPKNTPPGHKDGWGIAAYDPHGRIVAHEKEPRSAADNPAFAVVVEKIAIVKPMLFVAHLRKASVGGVTPENTQPHVYENFLFCHNGTVKDFESLPLEKAYTKLRKGASDSEWLFYYLVQEIRKNTTSLEMAVKNFIEKIRLLKYTACNALFSDGKILYAIREVNEKNERVIEGNLCDFYYTLFLGKIANQKAKIICSQRLDLEGITWSEIPNHAMAVVDLQTGREKIVAM